MTLLEVPDQSEDRRLDVRTQNARIHYRVISKSTAVARIAAMPL